MPSTHSATISYYATFISLACASLLPAGAAARVLLPVVVLPWATLIVLSRVWLGHHTWPQVAVGCTYGVAFAGAWFALWVGGLHEHGRKAEDIFNSLFE